LDGKGDDNNGEISKNCAASVITLTLYQLCFDVGYGVENSVRMKVGSTSFVDVVPTSDSDVVPMWDTDVETKSNTH